MIARHPSLGLAIALAFEMLRGSLIFLAAMTGALARPAGPVVPVGTAKIDITPELPIHLVGYSGRQAESQRIDEQLYARAIAIGSDRDQPAVLITVDLIGISSEVRDSVAAWLNRNLHVDQAHLAICATHSHSGPMLDHTLPFMFGRALSLDEAAHVHRYTEALRSKLEQVASAALGNRRPSRLAWAQGQVGFAINRRKVVAGKWVAFGAVVGKPVDHALPALVAKDFDGGTSAILVSYACHNVTLPSDDNDVDSDWAGAASREIEGEHPGTVALIALGCAGDANPEPRGTAQWSNAHGHQVAVEVDRLLGGPLHPLRGVTNARLMRIGLKLEHPVTLSELQDQLAAAKKPGQRYVLGQWIDECKNGRLPTSVPFVVQSWVFGDELAMVFLSGEVVSDYSLRLRRELDASKIWINAYSNGLPCYIPARSMYSEGGYEVDQSRFFYGIPGRLDPSTEDTIVHAVHRMLPPAFAAR